MPLPPLPPLPLPPRPLPSPAGLTSALPLPAHARVVRYHTWGVGARDGHFGVGAVPFRWPGIGYLKLKNSQPWELKTASTAPGSSAAVGLRLLGGCDISFVKGNEVDALAMLTIESVTETTPCTPTSCHESSELPPR